MQRQNSAGTTRLIGLSFIVFAVAFNLPFSQLATSFNYPAILRSPPGVILEAFVAGGTPLILTWAAFALCALLFGLIAIGVASVTRQAGGSSSPVAALGVAAGVTQAIGLSRWVYAVPGLASQWTTSAGDAGLRASIETTFITLHQFAGVGIGEAIGQTLTAFWLIGVALQQRRHPRFGVLVSGLGLIGGVVLLLGFVEGLATAIHYDPGVFGLAGIVGFLLLTVWLIWTGALCILRPALTA